MLFIWFSIFGRTNVSTNVVGKFLLALFLLRPSTSLQIQNAASAKVSNMLQKTAKLNCLVDRFIIKCVTIWFYTSFIFIVKQNCFWLQLLPLHNVNEVFLQLGLFRFGQCVIFDPSRTVCGSELVLVTLSETGWLWMLALLDENAGFSRSMLMLHGRPRTKFVKNSSNRFRIGYMPS